MHFSYFMYFTKHKIQFSISKLLFIIANGMIGIEGFGMMKEGYWNTGFSHESKCECYLFQKLRLNCS